jgi:hypothetical protein
LRISAESFFFRIFVDTGILKDEEYLGQLSDYQLLLLFSLPLKTEIIGSNPA